MTTPSPKFKLIFFVPPSALEACKFAVFASGAGRYPRYSECCFTSRGTGQFRPGDAAKPHVRYLVQGPARLTTQIGKVGELEEVDEYRVEVVCEGRDGAKKAIEALKK